MQQNSQVVELKDRLVQALDDQLNVKDINEVNRIISILERTNVTKEDLEKTRLGKYINDLRKKTTDKELAKRAKNLIKKWRDFAVRTSVTPSTTNNCISALTSPFMNCNSISPGQNNCFLKNNSNLTPPNSHPALIRVKNQHQQLTSSTNSSEKSKGYGRTVSPVSRTSPNSHNIKLRPNVASPKLSEKISMTNGFNSNLKKGTNLTPPINYHTTNNTNGLSPGMHNFKNLFTKESLSSNSSPNSFRNKRTTPPTPNSNCDSASSSRLCSPLAFGPGFVGENSRDSFHSSKNNNYLNNISSIDLQDDDSNSSQFSNFSNDGSNLLKRKNRKRKLGISDENDSLRENFNYVNSGGRRPQSTAQLIEKFNMEIPKMKMNEREHQKQKHISLSTSSSPSLIARIDLRNHQINNNHQHKNGSIHPNRRNGFHSEENSLDGFETFNSTKNKRSISPMLEDEDDGIAAFPEIIDDENVEDEEDEYDEDGVSYKAFPIQSSIQKVSKLEQEIQELYSNLPEIDPDVLDSMKDFKFDECSDIFIQPQIDEQNIDDDSRKSIDAEKVGDVSVDGDDDDEYETFEYEEEYESEDEAPEDGEMEGKDRVLPDPLVEDEEKGLNQEASSSFQNLNTKCDILKCDNDKSNSITTDFNDPVDGSFDDSIVDSNNSIKTEAAFNGIIETSINDHDVDQQNQEDSSKDINFNAISSDDDKIKINESSMVSIEDSIMDISTNQQLSENENSVVINKIKKKRKKYGKFKIKKYLVDRLADEKWESFNGNFDHEGNWRHLDEITTAKVFDNDQNTFETLFINDSNKLDPVSDSVDDQQQQQNILYILPYVNCSW